VFKCCVYLDNIKNWLTSIKIWGYLNIWAVSRLPLEGCFWKYTFGIPHTFVRRNVKLWCFWSLRALYLKRVVFSRLNLSSDWRNFPKNLHLAYNVHESVHHINILLLIIPSKYTIHRVYFYLTLLYMFRALPSLIVRSTKLL